LILLIPFLAVASLFVITPGPDVALVTRNALQHGRRAGLLTTAGITIGVLLWTGAAAVGVAAVLEANAIAFTVVRLAAAAYLMYLGVRVWAQLRQVTRPSKVLPNNHGPALRANSPFLQGVTNNIFNPKMAVFFTGLIPQFATPGPSQPLEFLELASTTGYLLAHPRVRRPFSAIMGTALVGLGVKAAVDSG